MMILVIGVIAPFTAYAADELLAAAIIPGKNEIFSGKTEYIADTTGTLTVAQIKKLNEKARALSEKRECGVYILIVDLVPEKYARTIDTMEEYAKIFFKEYNLGYGDEKNGMMLILEIGDVPGERDYLFYTHGSCKKIFNNNKREYVLDENIVPLFKDAFKNGDFYNVADTFLDKVAYEFAADILFWLVFKLVIVLLVPIITAGIVCASWKAKMKTAKTAVTADNYVPANGFRLTGQQDIFLYRTVTRTRIERESSSSSGGSSSSSSGSSSGGKV